MLSLSRILLLCLIIFILLAGNELSAKITNGDFETGDYTGGQKREPHLITVRPLVTGEDFSRTGKIPGMLIRGFPVKQPSVHYVQIHLS